MKRLIFWFFTFLYLTNSSANKTREYSSTICDNPPSVNVDPEKCCDFPEIFDESIMSECEKQANGSPAAVGDLFSDSCVIECMFNKSINSKLQRETMKTLAVNNTKNYDDGFWNKSLITKAIDVCFNEVTDDDMNEIVENIRKEIGSNTNDNKMCSPKTSLILDCFYRELFKVCPEQKFSYELSECNVLKNYTNTCDDW
ncbi:hypothetical protein PVAND_008654 [Polypedilum vanderplanki]|uniref:OBP47-like domain-containing protein n=1 Tax=Polypedilum vanderplanki TaxID=319348 RepID=A0A9J6CA93_POLVA|nr:hypothetical protein PVAND_008654 [Polypedilum vanderplanki]